MNRWLVLEAFADIDDGIEQVKMQVLNIHSSVTGAYLHWERKGSEHRLHLLDLKLQKAYSWAIAYKLMVYENLMRVQNEQRIDTNVQGMLIAGGYITPDMKIDSKGHDLIQELTAPPVKTIEIGHIKTSSKLFK